MRRNDRHARRLGASQNTRAPRGAPRLPRVDPLEPRTLLSVSLDPSFGTNGVSPADFGGASDEAFAVACLPGGKLLVAGRAQQGFGMDFALSRYDADGSLDESFGTQGRVVHDLGSDGDAPFAMLVQSDGRIVLAGQMIGPDGSYDFALARYLADGTVDSSFGQAGVSRIDFAGSFDQAFAVAQQADGMLVVGGVGTQGYTFEFALARVDQDGALDTTFGDQGRSMMSVGSGGGAAYAMALHDGKIILGGYSYGLLGSDMALARFNADGSPDATFGDRGLVIQDAGHDTDQVNALAVVGGQILAAGSAGGDLAIARFTEAGALDTTFGDAGLRLIDFASDADGAYALVPLSCGSIILAGFANAYTDGDVALACLTCDGDLNGDFDGDGLATVSLGSVDDGARALSVADDGSLIVAGYRYDDGTDYDWALARVLLNQAPIADAGAGYSVVEGSAVTLTGVASSDADGSIVAYEWDLNYDGVSFDVDAAGVTAAFSAALLDGPTTRMIALRVRDDGGAETIATAVVSVSNAAPTVDAGADRSALVGAAVNVTATALDPGVADALTLTWQVTDNSGGVVAQGAGASAAFTPASPGNYTLTFTASDDDGAVAMDSMLVAAASPSGLTANAGADQAVAEGTRVRITAGYTGPVVGTLSYLWHVESSNGQVVADGTTRTLYFTPADDGVYTVTLTLTDSLGNTSSDVAVVNSSNAAPVVYAGADRALNEGSRMSLWARMSDAGSLDTHTFLWHITSDNGQVIEDGATRSYSFVPVDNGVYTVQLTVTDDDGASSTDTMVVTVLNVAPSVRLGRDRTAMEGQSLTFTPSVSDRSSEDVLTASWTVKSADGTIVAQGNATPISFVPQDNGLYTVDLSVSDDDGGIGSDSMVVEVGNIAPSVRAGRDLSVYEGATVNVVGTFTDPGALDTHTVSWTVQADNGQVVAGGSSLSFSFVPQDQGKYVLTLSVTDDDGGVDTDTLLVRVSNAAPRVAVAGPASGVRGQERQFMGGYTDAGLVDTHMVAWDFGDGSSIGYVPATADSLKAAHVYKANGTYSLRFKVRDNDGAVTTATHTVTIRTAELQQDPEDFNLLALVVGGTTRNDSIAFLPGGIAGTVQVMVNGRNEGLFNPTGRIIAFGQEGNDAILGTAMTLAVRFHGGAGNDTLTGGAAADALFGDLGNDILDGAAGADSLSAGGGMDILLADASDVVI